MSYSDDLGAVLYTAHTSGLSDYGEICPVISPFHRGMQNPQGPFSNDLYLFLQFIDRGQETI